MEADRSGLQVERPVRNSGSGLSGRRMDRKEEQRPSTAGPLGLSLSGSSDSVRCSILGSASFTSLWLLPNHIMLTQAQHVVHLVFVSLSVCLSYQSRAVQQDSPLSYAPKNVVFWSAFPKHFIHLGIGLTVAYHF